MNQEIDQTNLDHVVIQKLKSQSLQSLLDLAISYNVENPQNMRKQELVFSILKKLAENNIPISTTGVLDVLQDGFGFLRFPESNYLPGPDDLYVSPSFIRNFGLKTGDTIECQVKPPKEGEKYFAVYKITKVNFGEVIAAKRRTTFDNLTPIYPDEMLTMEHSPSGVTQRVIDLVATIG